MSTPGTLQEIDKQLADLDTKLETVSSGMGAVSTGPLWWSTQNAMTMSSVVLIFGIVVIAIAGLLIWRGHSGTAVLRILGTILILVMAVFLVIAGYNDQQIAPVMGLLGTVAGYILGKERPADELNAETQKNKVKNKAGP